MSRKVSVSRAYRLGCFFFLIVGIILVVVGVSARSDSEWYTYSVSVFYTLPGIIIIITIVIIGIYFYLKLVIFFLIVGIILVVVGVSARSDSDWYYFVFVLYTLPGIIIIITTVISGIYFYLESPLKFEEKKNYMNLKWLNHQYYELGRSLQDIANDQGVSMITIKKWVDKLDVASVVVGAKE